MLTSLLAFGVIVTAITILAICVITVVGLYEQVL